MEVERERYVIIIGEKAQKHKTGGREGGGGVTIKEDNIKITFGKENIFKVMFKFERRKIKIYTWVIFTHGIP